MNLSSQGRTLAPVLALFLVGCAAADRQSYDTIRIDVDRAVIVDPQQPEADDPVVRGPVLDRAAYVRAVLHRNLSIEAARQGWRAALARVRQSGALEDPMVTLDVAPLSIGSSSARFGFGATISQHLPWPGKLPLEESVARAEADAEKSDYEAARRELALTASLLFDEYFVAARSLDINAQHVELMRTMRAGALAQFEAGRASAQDPLQAEFELTHMEHDAVILASQSDVTTARMNELLHRPPERPLPPPPKDLPAPAGPDVTDVQRLENEAVDRRPDVMAARQRARAEGARGDRAARESLPDITISTSYNSMWDTPEHRWMVGLGFNLPIQTGRRGGAVDQANASRAKFEADAERMADAARTEVVVALKQLEESAHVLHIYEERLLPIARDEVRAARSAFTASQAPFVAAIDAEKNLRTVELELEVARADHHRRRVELDRALGRMPGLDEKDGAQ
ncbi:MAG TPA: TolC family protein [Polyangiaceae bacterium]|nr:TolC family protein [Polyangiaceae bacterium]